MLDTINIELDCYKKKLRYHSLYSALNTRQSIINFMQLHIYSVWDFMNLLKILQANLTCLSIPWVPSRSPKLARLINEIVLEEESDIINGVATSHFFYYHQSLKLLDPSIKHITQFLSDLNSQIEYKELIIQSYIPTAAQKFMNFTYSCTKKSVLEVAAAFTFGRETLVPELFEPIKSQLKQTEDEGLTKFVSYLERHIQLDGEQHSKLAYEMVSILAKNQSDWDLIKTTAIKSLEARIKFWDDISTFIDEDCGADN